MLCAAAAAAQFRKAHMTTTPIRAAAPLASVSTTSVAGLVIALFATPAFVAGYRWLTGENHSDAQIAVRELGIFALLILLLWWVRAREQLPFASIGLQSGHIGRSLLRGCVLALIALAVTVGVYFLLRSVGIRLGERTMGAFQPGPAVAALVAVRAGIVEETFYRGYAIERLQVLTGRPWLAGLICLTVFAAAHYRQGIGGVLAVFVIGGVMTLFYLRFRDLIANITGHALTDLVLNVLLPLLGAG
jgi:uncharacterized protein